MLKLISGTLVGGVKYSDIYIEANEDEDTSSTNDYVNNNDKGQDKTQHKYQHYQKQHKKWQGLKRHNWMKNNILHMR